MSYRQPELKKEIKHNIRFDSDAAITCFGQDKALRLRLYRDTVVSGGSSQMEN